MSSVPPPTVPRPAAEPGSVSHIRGSSLLLMGRVLALGIGLATEVALVRFLAKEEYGILGFGLSLVGIGATFAALGFDKSAGRFIPIYEEEGRAERVLGSVAMMTGVIALVGVALVAGAHLLGSPLLAGLVGDPERLSVVLALAALIPIYALVSLALNLLTVFARPRAIFVRRYLLAPGFELVAVVAALALGSDLELLALAYVLAGSATLAMYAAALVGLLRRGGRLRRFPPRAIADTGREIVPFAMPLLSTDLVFVLRSSFLIVLLQSFAGAVEVAEYRAVIPIAQQNLVVLQTFTFLFTPIAARLFARRDTRGIHDLYWRSAVWIAVITYPLFLVSFALAEPLTVFLYGERYASSAAVMTLLALGYYLNAALGFNGLTLRVFGKVRLLVVADLLSAAIGLAASVALIQLAGAIGAAVGFCVTLVLQNVLYHLGLARIGLLSRSDLPVVGVYALLGGVALGLLVVQLLLSPPLIVGLVLAGGCALAVAWALRRRLQLGEVFPELRSERLRRIPVLRHWV